MKNDATRSFSLTNFEGPLDLLWHLIQHQEIDIYEVALNEIIQQYLQKSREIASINIERGAEFIGFASLLLWFKSKTLLPTQDGIDDLIPEDLDPRFEIIHQLLDYCRFKHSAKLLVSREETQMSHFFRGVPSIIHKKNLGIDHLSIEDLAALFSSIIAKIPPSSGLIQEEIWKVSDKINILRYLLTKSGSILVQDIFSSDKGREELIVTFLALLELMKAGEIRIDKNLFITQC